jgi:hypothetical protein
MTRRGALWQVPARRSRRRVGAGTPCRKIPTDEAEKRGRLIRHLEEALALADEIEDGQTGFLIERTLGGHANSGLAG